MPAVYLSLGSNIRRSKNIRTAVGALTDKFDLLRLSSVYESESVGFAGPHFYNLVAQIDTDIPLPELGQWVRALEARQGRVRGDSKYNDRTLDIDILLYGNVITAVPIKLPRDEILNYAFVLKPLAEIAPGVIHPSGRLNYRDLWRLFRDPRQRLWRIRFDW